MRMSITTNDNACTGATICAVTLNHLRYSAVYETSSIASVLGTMKPKRSTSTISWFSGPKIALRISRNGPPASITTSMLPIASHMALRTRERVCSACQLAELRLQRLVERQARHEARDEIAETGGHEGVRPSGWDMCATCVRTGYGVSFRRT